MNHIEFNVLVQGLFLTQDQVRQIGGYKDQRQIRRFTSGEWQPHDDLIDKLLSYDSFIDKNVSDLVNNTIKSESNEISVIGYVNNKKHPSQYEEWSDMTLPFIEMHHCMLFRLMKACREFNIKCSVIPFDEDSYIDFIERENLDDNQDSMSSWAAHF